MHIPRIICISLVLFMVIALHAQVTVNGNVCDKTNRQALENVIVSLKEEGHIIKYVQTDASGNFSIQLPQTTGKHRQLQFSLLSYKKQILPMEESSQTFHVELEPTSIQLEEVVIRMNKIGQKGDTISYNVASFAREQDRTIGDILKKMPGIQVQTNGEILYNGMNINKFYIEGKDLLGGRYGLATNGISYKDISKVEIYENHQPIRALQNIAFSENAALNLKLKDSSKTKWIGNGEIEGGYGSKPEGLLWDTKGLAMRFNKQFQHLSTLKSNNIGDNLKDSYQDFQAFKMTGDDSYLKPSAINLSDLDKKRTLANQTFLVSSSGLWGEEQKLQIKAQVNYLKNRETNECQTQKTYFLSDKATVIKEEENATNQQHSLSANITIEKNADRFYINNRLTGECLWNTNRLYTNRDERQIMQKAHLPAYQAGNDFQLVKKIGNRALNIQSKNQYKYLPQYLNISESGNPIVQQVTSRLFCSNQKISYDIPWRRFVFSLKGELSGTLHSLDSRLTGENIPVSSSRNDLSMKYLSANVSPQIEYSSQKWNISFSFPVNFHHYASDNPKEKKDNSSIAPMLGGQLKLSNRIHLFLQGSIHRSPNGLEQIYPAYILTSHYILEQGMKQNAMKTSKSISGTLTYRKPEQEIFSHLSIIYSQNSLPYLKSQDFIDSYLMQSMLEQENTSRSTLILGNFSKCLDIIQGTIDINANYMHSQNSMLSGGEKIPYVSTFFRFSSQLTGHLFHFLNWSYELKYNLSSLKKSTDTSYMKLHKLQHTWGLYAKISRKLSTQTTGEYYHSEISTDLYKDICMVDFRINYQCNSKMDFSIRLNNILDHKHYKYALYNDFSALECIQSLRGRELLIGFSVKGI